MKIIVIGLGSMGKRRIRLIQRNYNNIEIIGIDLNEDRRNDAERNFGLVVYSDLISSIKKEKPFAAFVCTSPESHPIVVKTCIENSLHVFSEINLIGEKHNELLTMADEKKLRIFVSSTMLYRRETQYIKGIINDYPGKIHYNYHVGQYLPDWHPWENYQDYFVSNMKTNGCRELFAIELPWLLSCFGKIINFYVMKDKLTELKLDFPDAYLLVFEHENGNKGIINLNIVSRIAVRQIEIISENLYISWDGKPSGLYNYSFETNEKEKIELYDCVTNEKGYAENIIEEAYLDEIRIFLNMLNGEEANELYTMHEEFKVLKLIDKIER